MKSGFTICHYDFNSDIESELINNHRDFLTWPIVYFLNDNRVQEAYVGETTDVINRLKTHSKNDRKQKLSSVHLILSELFNKSAALDLESYLIRYISADGKYTLQNGNLGISNHQYYQQKEVYWEVFKDIWSELRSLGIARHSLEHIDNSDLFKYSPYKSLSREQIDGLKMILNCLLDDKAKISLIQGGAGTGKSILAIFLFKLLKTKLEDFNFSDFEEEDQGLFKLLEQVKQKYGNLNMALVIPMASFRKTISNVFRNVKGLSPKMVIGPSELAKQQYDLIIVDEGHRLRRRINLGPYFKPFDDTAEKFGLDKFTSSELDWVLRQSKKALIFYDRYQSIKPSDVLRERFKKIENEPTTRIETLKTQFRSKGGNNFVNFIHYLLDGNSDKIKPFQSSDYDLRLFDNLEALVSKIKLKERSVGLSRLVAGYAWEWISKNDKAKFDIEIENVQLQWNSVAIDWVNSPNSINEVGCIHTTQGYDLNYVGVIIGPELDYDFDNKELVIYKDRYKDKAGKNTVGDELVLKDFIINIYKTILLRGIEGAYVYACNKNMQTYIAQFMPTETEEKEKSTIRILNAPNEQTIPFYDLKVAAGSFSDQQQVEHVKYIELDNSIPNQDSHFACKVIGESMNKIIPNASVCLFETYSGGSRNGRIVLVEMTDFTDADSGSSYTIKEYSSKKTTSEDGWKHEEIVLLPKSTKEYEPITLRDEETIGLKVVGVFVRVLHQSNTRVNE
ncbi:MAG TPA: DNA/RNA helicase domain-containing protein [Phnomibacter sp.]|nr:DNA/RNA helicase domain-containing protein [Phnomibacter sp.]